MGRLVPDKNEFTLLKNAVCFFEESLKEGLLAERDVGRWKYAMLFLFQATELTLKECVFRQHPLLIFEDVDRRGKKTVTTDSAIKRLSNCGIYLKKEDLTAIDNLRETRNKIVHGSFELDREVWKAVFSSLVVFLVGFFEENIGVKIEREIDTSSLELLKKIKGYQEKFLAQALRKIENLDAYIFDCTSCSNRTVALDEEFGELRCYFCNRTNEGMECRYCKTVFPIEKIVTEFFEIKRFNIKVEGCENCISQLSLEDVCEK